jgi:uncharacterized protein YprB with RNaseH-like and TPR domain
MSYLEHYNCYLKEKPEENRIGFFDIETSNLDANFGIVLCYCIKTPDGDILGRKLTKEECLNTKKSPDIYLMKELIKDLNKFDILYGYYSTKFDIPFIRSRCVSNNIDFPVFGSIKHKDIYYIIKNKFKLNRNSLEVACRELVGTTLKNHFDGNMWRHAVQGNEKALEFIFDHCKRDVIDLELLANKVIDFANPNTTKSI